MLALGNHMCSQVLALFSNVALQTTQIELAGILYASRYNLLEFKPTPLCGHCPGRCCANELQACVWSFVPSTIIK